MMSGNGTEDGLRSVLAQGAASSFTRVVRDDLVVAVGLSGRSRGSRSGLDNPRRARATFVSLVGALRIGGTGSGNPYPATDAFRDCVRRHGRASPCSGHRAQRRMPPGNCAAILA